MIQELILGVTSQVLVIESTRPLSAVASVKLYEADGDDTSTEETAVSGAGTVDSASTTTSAAAGVGQANPNLLALTSSTGLVVGRKVYVTKGGLAETVEIAQISGNNVYTRHPLLNAYASGATVKGNLRATINVDNTWAADLANLSANDNPNPRYRARAAVTYATDLEGSVAESDVLDLYVDLVRYPSIPRVDSLHVEQAHRGWLNGLDEDDRSTQGRRLIDEAADLVRHDLAGKGIAIRSVKSVEVKRRLVVARVVWARVEANVIEGGATLDALKAAQEAYERQVAALVESPVLAQDKAGGGGITTRTGRATRVLIR